MGGRDYRLEWRVKEHPKEGAGHPLRSFRAMKPPRAELNSGASLPFEISNTACGCSEKILIANRRAQSNEASECSVKEVDAKPALQLRERPTADKTGNGLQKKSLAGSQ